LADPRAEYGARAQARRAEVERLERRDRALAHARTVVFLAGLAVGWLTWGRELASGWWVALPAALFAALVALHDRALQSRRRAERAVAYYARGLARLDGKWAGAGEPGERFVDAEHPFARDLDLFGHASLFELLCTARTRAGEEALAAWLRAPAASSPAEVRARQSAIAELRERVDLREELAVLGGDLRAEVSRPEDLAEWGERPPLLAPAWGLRLFAAALAALAVAAALGWTLGRVSGAALAIVFAVELLVYRALRERLDRVSGAVGRAARDLQVLAAVVARLEREPATSARLVALKAQLTDEGMAASRRIAELARLADLLAAQQNQFFLPLALLLMWAVQLSCAIERWRARHGRAIRRWLAAAGELEALAALAGYAYEHPRDPFPEILDVGALLDGEALGHPLLPEATCVRNDVRLGGDGPHALLVSGSNMSGKSTLLRTVGTNVVLALAGAPVRASRLRLAPLQVGATLRIQDSLLEGSSRFYAEITRLRQLVDLTAAGPPLLFLLDEILHGTNSHDRRIGAEGVVRGLVERGAIGLVTTHDLALAEMAEALGTPAANVHFEDHLENGTLSFDYKMRPGVVRKSNALELMRAVGLNV
jgi:hypothetical protein